MSGPVTLGSVGFTGKALTSGAPVEGMDVLSHLFLSKFEVLFLIKAVCYQT